MRAGVGERWWRRPQSGVGGAECRGGRGGGGGGGLVAPSLAPIDLARDDVTAGTWRTRAHGIGGVATAPAAAGVRVAARRPANGAPGTRSPLTEGSAARSACSARLRYPPHSLIAPQEGLTAAVAFPTQSSAAVRAVSSLWQLGTGDPLRYTLLGTQRVRFPPDRPPQLWGWGGTAHARAPATPAASGSPNLITRQFAAPHSPAQRSTRAAAPQAVCLLTAGCPSLPTLPHADPNGLPR
ncbi:uncharacterized protein LOC126278926 [Schistocerca gregaria]|uniref:uncharacterized protein LOC126278926 n=1 Tax=Schistocerca gregaria TaxID=7010 RepID=UPI00211F2495|nr:uncharacterized protein LOC126278926 [Schistocerca gregaria]